MDDVIAANRRRWTLLMATSFLLIAVPVAVLLAVFGLGLLGVALGLALGALVTAGCWWSAKSVALRRSQARPAALADHPRLHNLVEGLCAAHGVEMPDLHLVDDPAPNAFAAGRSADHAAIVVTQGLLDVMSRVELEAVMAHELSQIKSEDVLVDTAAVTMPVPARLVHLVMAQGREPRNDMAAVAMTRFPPALASALAKLRDADTVVSASSWATAHLWIAAPRSGSETRGDAAAEDARFDDHQPLDERIALLQEL